MSRTQVERVIAAADSLRGVCQVEFLGIETVDGGPTITRLAARIQDAEDKGYVFESLGKRHDCKVYRLVSRPEFEVEGSAGEQGPATLKDCGPVSAASSPTGVSVPPSIELNSKPTPNGGKSGSSEPLSLFTEVGKPLYGFAEQEKMDEAA